MGKSCGKILQEILAGKSCGKFLRKFLWQILAGNLAGNSVANFAGNSGIWVCMAGGMHGRGVHGRGHAWLEGMHGRGHACKRGVWQGGLYDGGVLDWGHVWKGCAWQLMFMAGEVCMAGQMATALGGKNPTGMHSCFHYFGVAVAIMNGFNTHS